MHDLRRVGTGLANNLMVDNATHIRQAKLSPLMRKCQLRMIDTQQMQYRRVKIIDMHFVFYDVKAQIVGLAISQTTFHATARHPRTKRVFVMISSGILTGFPLKHRRPTKLRPKDDQRIVQ